VNHLLHVFSLLELTGVVRDLEAVAILAKEGKDTVKVLEEIALAMATMRDLLEDEKDFHTKELSTPEPITRQTHER
jgi:hypothetical protein